MDDSPDRTPPREVRPLAEVRAPGWAVEHVAATASTNALAGDRVREGALDRLAVLTDHQTAGRGRLDRTWQTPAGVALTVSLVLDPAQPDERWPWLPLLTGLAVRDALAAVAPNVPVGLKWPNDVLVAERKLAGILLERVTGPHGPRAVAGIGINVHQRTLPVDTATSLAVEGADVDRASLLEALLLTVHDRLSDWSAPGGYERLRTAYAGACVTLGREVVAHLPGGETLSGRAVAVDGSGRIVLQTLVRGEAGRVAIGAGDVVHLRAVPDEGSGAGPTNR